MSKPVRRAWIPALLWLAVIAFESTPLMSSDNTGHLLLAVARFFDPRITLAQLELLNGVGRKIGHCLVYGILSLLMLRAWWATLMLPRTAPLSGFFYQIILKIRPKIREKIGKTCGKSGNLLPFVPST